jgi:MATE family multidrug resistance protein
MVGHLGGTALAAAGLGGALYFTLVMVCQGLLTAVAPLAAHATGADDHRAAARIAGGGMALAAMLALPVLLLLSTAPHLFAMLGYQAVLAEDIASYLSAIRWASPAFLSVVVLRAMLSAASRPRPIMVLALLGIPANAALNWLLIYGHLGMPALGIVGPGWATTIVQWTTALTLACYVVLRGRPALPRFLWPRPRDLTRIIAVGLPISGLLGLEAGLFSFTGLLMGQLGAEPLGAHQLAMNFSGLTFMVPLGIGQAATVRVALHLGSRRPDAARRAGFLAVALGATLMLAPCALMLAAPQKIASIYLDIADPQNAGTLRLAEQLLAVAALFQVFDGTQVIAAGALRGYRDTATPMLIAALGYWAIGFIGGWMLAFPLRQGAIGLWWGLAMGLASVSILLVLRLVHRSRFGDRDAAMTPAPAAARSA